MDTDAIETALDGSAIYDRDDVVIERVESGDAWPTEAQQCFSRLVATNKQHFNDVRDALVITGEHAVEDEGLDLLDRDAVDDAIDRLLSDRELWVAERVVFADGTTVWTFNNVEYESLGLWAQEGAEQQVGAFMPI